jgi:predicted house-cleaning noncanonical NTP pyrophosphatase (MazG superfamily)
MKLVRDKIPKIILDSGMTPVVSNGKGKHFSFLLYSKLIEELGEFMSDPCAEEAADMLEVFTTLLRHHDLSLVQVSGVADRKRAERGGFNAGAVLHEVIDDKNRKSS